MSTTSLRVAAWLCVLFASSLTASERYEASEPHMGTLVQIALYADTPDQAQQAFVAGFARIAQLNRILSDYDPESELSRVCEADTRLSRELLTVLNHGQKLAEETKGAFDITVGPITRLWRMARREKQLPSKAQIAEALNRSGFRKLKVRSWQIGCTVPGMKLDAGGVAKGFAGDEALVAMRKAGVTSAMVAISGDIVLGDAPPEKPGWRVQVLGQTLTLSNAAVSTSGDEFQFIELGGTRYSHIVDPRTGMALRNSHAVGVVAKKGIDADSIATAVSVAGPAIAKKLSARHQIRIITERKASAIAHVN